MNPQSPASLVREFDPNRDYPSLSALYAAVETADHLGSDPSETALRAASPERRRWVAESSHKPGNFLAHAWLQPQSPTRGYFFTAVHPDWRRRRLGSALFACCLDCARELGVKELAAYLRADQIDAGAFLQYCGFQVMGTNRFMKASASLTQEAPHWPEGFTIRSLAETGDLDILVRAHNLCYASHWGHYENSTTLTVEKLQEFMKEYPDSFIPEGIFLLFAPNGEIAGLTYGRLSADNGSQNPKTRIVDSPGVAPEFSHLDLHRPLTQLTLQWLRMQGDGPIELHCFGEDEETAAVYTSLGFTLGPQDTWMESMRSLDLLPENWLEEKHWSQQSDHTGVIT
jgi:GNAT superfamily N-acetyltransferase